MIENHSKFDKKDVTFTIKMWLWRNPLAIIYRVVCAVLCFWFMLCGMSNLFSNQTGVELILFGLFLGYMSLFSLSNIYKSRVKKNPIIKIPRNIKITDSEITIEAKDSGTKIKNTFKISEVSKYYLTKNSVVVELKNKKGNIFLHDDCYKIGSKEKLINLLNKNNVEKGNYKNYGKKIIVVAVTLFIMVAPIFIGSLLEKSGKVEGGWSSIEGGNIAKRLYKECDFSYEDAVETGRNIFRSKKINIEELLEDIRGIKEQGKIVNAKKEDSNNLTASSTYYGDGYFITALQGGECDEYFIYNNDNEEIGEIVRLMPFSTRDT